MKKTMVILVSCLMGVAFAAELPSGYTRLAYLESSGKVWFDSGYKPADGHRIDFDMETLSNTTMLRYLGCYDGSGGVGVGTHSIGSWQLGYNLQNPSPLVYPALGRHLVTIFLPGYDASYPSGLYRPDDVDLQKQYASSATTTMAIFGHRAANGTVTASAMKFHSLRISNTSELVHEYLPVRRDGDGALGLYDTCAASDGFIAATGTGTLTAGPDYVASFVKIGDVSYDSIEAAYDMAEKGDVISVYSGSDPIRLTSERLIVEKAVTIRGAGATPSEAVIVPFRRAEDAVLLTLSNADARLENLTLAEARYGVVNDETSGASPILINSGIVSNCVIRDCYGLGARYGAVTMYGGSIFDSVLENNVTAYRSGGNGSVGFGGALSLLGGAPLVTNCIIKGNTAYQSGGGVYCAAKEALVQSCIISNNIAKQGSGAGAYISAGTFDRCAIVANNECKTAGAGLCLDARIQSRGEDGTPLVQWCLVADNVAACSATGVKIARGLLVQCTIASNSSSNSKPGGLTQTGGEIANCLFALNNGIGSTPMEKAFSRTSGTMTNCVSDVDIPGGGTVADNTVGTVVFKDAAHGDYHLMPGTVATHAGCYEYDAGSLTCMPLYDGLPHDGKTPIQFSAFVEGAGAGDVLSYAWDFENDGTIDSTLADPEWEKAPYGVHHVKLTVTSSSGASSTAYVAKDVSVLPAVVYVSSDGSKTWPYDTQEKGTDDFEAALESVCATEIQPGTVIVGEGTYDIQSFWAKVEIPVIVQGAGADKSVLRGYNGGASYRRVMYVNHPLACVRGLTLTNGRLFKTGEGDYVEDGSGPAGLRLVSGTVSECVICDNNGSDNAGGVEMRGGKLENCRVLRNRALRFNNSTVGHGAGIAITGSGVTVIGCEISGNLAEVSGAGLWIAENLSGVCVSNCVLSCNTNGTNRTVANSGKNGSCIWAGSGKLDGCIVRENVNRAYWASPLITGEAAVYLTGSATLRGSLVVRNSSDWGAQGVSMNGANCAIVNCTVSDNGQESYAADEIWSSRLTAGTLRNSIIWGDLGGATLSIAGGVTTGNNLTDQDPQFYGAGKHFYRIRRSSPAIDVGDNAAWGDDLSVSTDIQGSRRLVGSRIDIGCYENAQKGLVISVW